MPQRRRAPGRRRARKRTATRPWWLLILAVVIVGALIAARLLRAPGSGPRQGATSTTVDVYFVRYAGADEAGTLVAAHRSVPAGADDARVAAALGALLAGPSAAERRQGLVSEVPPGTSLRSVHVSGSVATVDLTGSFTQGGGSSAMLARLWQVVYTATQTPAAHAVQLTIDGRRVRAIGGEGLIVDTPIARPASMPTF